MSENFQIINKIETDIEKAADFCQKEYTEEEIFDVLKKSSAENQDTDTEKQICILKIDTVSSQNEADILIFHLTNHCALVREACALKVNELMLSSGLNEIVTSSLIGKPLLDKYMQSYDDTKAVKVLNSANLSYYFFSNYLDWQL